MCTRGSQRYRGLSLSFFFFSRQGLTCLAVHPFTRHPPVTAISGIVDTRPSAQLFWVLGDLNLGADACAANTFLMSPSPLLPCLSIMKWRKSAGPAEPLRSSQPDIPGSIIQGNTVDYGGLGSSDSRTVLPGLSGSTNSLPRCNRESDTSLPSASESVYVKW